MHLSEPKQSKARPFITSFKQNRETLLKARLMSMVFKVQSGSE